MYILIEKNTTDYEIVIPKTVGMTLIKALESKGKIQQLTPGNIEDQNTD